MEPLNMPYELLRKITDDFSEERILGRGSFGVVYKGVLADGKAVAVKVLNMSGVDDTEFKNEFHNLVRLKHQNIVQLVGYCNESVKQVAEYDGRNVIAEKTHTALCFEYVNNGNLSKHISDQNQGLDWHIRYKIIEGICQGLKYLREGLKTPIWHLDLKPENILLDEKMTPKIADFGLSRLISDERTRSTLNSVGTCGYWPPEYVRFQLLSESFDIFSLGVITTKIMIGTEGYHSSADMPPQKFVKHVCNIWRKKLEEILRPRSVEVFCKQVKACIEIASKCLKADRHERPSIQEIMFKLNVTETMMLNLSMKKTEQFRLLMWWRGGSSKGSDGLAGGHGQLQDAVRTATDGFFGHSHIGCGAYGSMYRGRLADGREVAIRRAGKAELPALARSNHKNIVALLGCCSDNSGEALLVYEFMANGTLHDQLHSRRPTAPLVLSWRGRLAVALDAARGIEYMHVYAVPRIIHRDIKSANIFFDDFWMAKIGAFGSCVLHPPTGGNTPDPGHFGTVGYLDPEYCQLQRSTDKSDVYSFGVVLLELLSGCLAVQCYDESMERRHVVDVTVPRILDKNDVASVLDTRLPMPMSDEAEALSDVGYLAANCVSPVGRHRPSMTEVVDILERALAACTPRGWQN